MPKGRPPFEPRIAALEEQAKLLRANYDEIYVLYMKLLSRVEDALASKPPGPYQPNFEHWPNASGRTINES